jgi:hypothetical protein
VYVHLLDELMAWVTSERQAAVTAISLGAEGVEMPEYHQVQEDFDAALCAEVFLTPEDQEKREWRQVMGLV